MSGCEGGFAILAPTDAFQCTHNSGLLQVIAGWLWLAFVLSSFAAGVPILIFWCIVTLCVYLSVRIVESCWRKTS